MHLPSPTITPIETESLPKKQSGLEKVPIPTFGMINPSAAIRSSSSCAVLLATPSFLASTLLEGIRILFSALPCILLIVGILLMVVFPLTDDRVRKMQAEIKARKSGTN